MIVLTVGIILNKIINSAGFIQIPSLVYEVAKVRYER